MKDITIAISGMSCSHCLNAVNRALGQIPQVEIRSLRIGQAELRVPETPGLTQRIEAALGDAGYKVEGITGQ